MNNWKRRNRGGSNRRYQPEDVTSVIVVWIGFNPLAENQVQNFQCHYRCPVTRRRLLDSSSQVKQRSFRAFTYTLLARLKRVAASVTIKALTRVMMARSKPKSQRTRPEARPVSANAGMSLPDVVVAEKTMMRKPSTP